MDFFNTITLSIQIWEYDMSAIWGTITRQDFINPNLPKIMEASFGEPFSIDRITSIVQKNLYFGCGLQYITKESKNEKLPIENKEQNLFFVADCYLDNRSLLLEELSPHNSQIADGTLMYLAYQKWGIKCLNHFLGTFSMVVYEENTKTLYLCADQTSSRCLYYHQNGESITFSTLLDPILKLYPTIEKNEVYLKDFLIAPKLRPFLTVVETPYKNVFKLAPATYLEISPKGILSHTYWDPSMSIEHTPPISIIGKKYGKAFRELFYDCIKDSLRTEENIAIALSSGLDSSSIGVLAADYLKENKKDLYAYTYVPYYEVHSAYENDVLDESQAVKEIVKMHPNILPHFLNNHGKSAFPFIKEELELFEIPFKAFANIPCFLEMYEQARKDHCRILLTGQCGNTSISFGEVHHIFFDLYISHKYITLLSYINHYCKALKRSRKKVSKGLFRLLKEYKKEWKNYEFHYTLDNPFLSKDILKNYDVQKRFYQDNTEKYPHKYITSDVFHEFLLRKPLCSFLGEINTKLDLYYGTLYRDPTNNPRILHFLYYLPYHYFAYQGTPRWLIHGNFQDLLPASILNKWLRYGVQSADWMERLNKDWNTISKDLENTLENSSLSSYFDKEKIHSFFLENKNSLKKDCSLETQYIFFLYILSVFLS